MAFLVGVTVWGFWPVPYDPDPPNIYDERVWQTGRVLVSGFETQDVRTGIHQDLYYLTVAKTEWTFKLESDRGWVFLWRHGEPPEVMGAQ